jgi:cytochrome c2
MKKKMLILVIVFMGCRNHAVTNEKGAIIEQTKKKLINEGQEYYSQYCLSCHHISKK